MMLSIAIVLQVLTLGALTSANPVKTANVDSDAPIFYPVAPASLDPPTPYVPLPKSQLINGTAHVGNYSSDNTGLESRQDSNGHFHLLFCSGSHRSGQCIYWGQKAHCWDFYDPNLNPYNDAISSVYPQEAGVQWTLWEDAGCRGAGLNVWGNIDDLRDYNFNDRTSAFSWKIL